MANQGSVDGSLGDLIDELFGEPDPAPEAPAGPGDQVEPDPDADPPALGDGDGDTPDTDDPKSDSLGLTEVLADPSKEPALSAPRWAQVRVSGASFTDAQEADLREQLADDTASHVLVIKEGAGTEGYSALQGACDALTEYGYPLQFHGRLLRDGKALTYASVACRDVATEDPVKMLQQLVGFGDTET